MRPSGHIGIGLVLIAVVIFRLDDSTALRFTALAVPASLLPDVDVFLPVPHQGVLHTYPVMFLVSVVGGILIAGSNAVLGRIRDAEDDAGGVTPGEAFTLSAGAFLLGTVGHITLDLVSYRESLHGRPVEPLWPFTEWVPQVNLFPADPLLWNLGFLGLGVAAWVAAYRNSPR